MEEDFYFDEGINFQKPFKKSIKLKSIQQGAGVELKKG